MAQKAAHLATFLPVGVVESGLFYQNVNGQLVENPMKGGQLPDTRKTPPFHGVVHEIRGWDADGDLVEQYAPNHLIKPP